MEIGKAVSNLWGGRFASIGEAFYKLAKLTDGAATGTTADANANAKAGKAITDSFLTTNKALDGILKGFLDRLTSIFSVDTEANAKAGIAAARADKDAAQKNAAKQSRIQTQSGTPFGQVGGFLGGLASGGIGQLFGNMLKPSSDQMKALKEERKKIEEESAVAYQKYVEQYHKNTKAGLSNNTLIGNELDRRAVVKNQLDENTRKQQALFNKPSTSLLDMDFKGMGNAISNVAQTAAANVDPKAVMKQRRKDLNIEAKNLRERIKQTPRFLGMGGGAMGNDAIRQGLMQRLAENRQELAGLVAKPAALRAQMSRGSLQDIVSATVGTFRQTRGNLLKVAGGKSIDQQQLDTLRQVVDNTGGPSDSIFSVMKDLSNRADPFVFQ